MTTLIMHQTVTKHDAIGNDIATMYEIMCGFGECVIFANYCFNNLLTYVDEQNAREIASDPNNVVIYHHSVFWAQGEELIRTAKAKVVLRYHNITPPVFFAPYDSFAESQCRNGRKQTENLVNNFPQAYWLCDSEFNSWDVMDIQKNNVEICPPFHKIESWASEAPDEKVLETLLFSDQINLLFVGRVAPNKGHLFLLDVLHTFRANYSKDAHLWVIGKFDDALEGYNKLIFSKIEACGLQNCVHFVGEINDAIMSAYYLGCDFFVCASEHEGFCVPLEEAQYFKLPVLAKRSSAIPETLGSGQLVFGDAPRMFAAAIKLLYDRPKYMRWIVERGRENYNDRFTYEKNRAIFLKAMKKWKII